MTNNDHITTWSKVQMTWGMVSPNLSLCSAKFGCHRCYWNADRCFYIFHMTTWSNDHMTWLVVSSNIKLILCLSGLDLSTVSYHSAKFGGHRYCGSVNIRFYNCHMTTWSKGHLTTYVGSSESKLPPCQVWWS